LLPGERITDDAESGAWIRPWNDLGAGRAFLTTQRLIWIWRASPIIRRLLFWIPDVVVIPFASIESLKVTRQLLNRAWLRINVQGKGYAFRLGRGPYPLLRDNVETTEEWAGKIEQARTNSNESEG